MTPIQVFAFVILPLSLAGFAWAFVLVSEWLDRKNRQNHAR